MDKTLVRTWAATGCRAAMLLALAERQLRGDLIILCYHRVLPPAQKADYFSSDLAVSPEGFRQHCRTLARHYKVLPLQEALAVQQVPQRSDRPLAAITFDDGYQDNFRYAAPILRDMGIRATFFAVSHLVGEGHPPWYDRLASSVRILIREGRAHRVLADCELSAMSDRELRNDGTVSPKAVVAWAKRMAPERRRALVDRLGAATNGAAAPGPDDLIMTWSQLKELADQGHEIGSHSASHEMLTQLDDASLERELVGSRTALEAGIGRPVRSFCYPNGGFDDRVAAAVAAAGYTTAVTVRPGVNDRMRDPFRLHRWFIHEERLADAKGRASPTLMRMELCGLAHRVFGRRIEEMGRE